MMQRLQTTEVARIDEAGSYANETFEAVRLLSKARPWKARGRRSSASGVQTAIRSRARLLLRGVFLRDLWNAIAMCPIRLATENATHHNRCCRKNKIAIKSQIATKTTFFHKGQLLALPRYSISFTVSPMNTDLTGSARFEEGYMLPPGRKRRSTKRDLVTRLPRNQPGQTKLEISRPSRPTVAAAYPSMSYSTIVSSLRFEDGYAPYIRRRGLLQPKFVRN